MNQFLGRNLICRLDLRKMSARRNRKIVYPACERNKQPILEVLKQYLPTDRPSNMLELASGTGQHVVHFAPHFPNITFQPSEIDEGLMRSIICYINDCPTQNIHQPAYIDVTTDCRNWKLPDAKYEFILNVNMIHISPYTCTEGLFRNAGALLVPYGCLITYGPYANEGVIEPQSNINFDRSLRNQNSEWGLRDIKDLKILAEQNGLQLIQIHDMPANNKTLIWRKFTG